MRVLYVAMTRPKDRLIMTYASRNLQSTLADMSFRMDICDPYLMTADVDCPGKWVLYTALRHREADVLRVSENCTHVAKPYDKEWLIRLVKVDDADEEYISDDESELFSPQEDFSKLRAFLSFDYPYKQATRTPSKQTATQLKGRIKDIEAAEDTAPFKHPFSWRKPTFLQQEIQGKEYGKALHTVMQYIDYSACTDIKSIASEMNRLVERGFISQECCEAVDPAEIDAFFSSQIGKQIRESKTVLREFKFSLMDGGENYGSDLKGENVLLQGVVDCALIDDDGIRIIDFKTDQVTEKTLNNVVEQYRKQVDVYASALTRIFNLPVTSKYLYFFYLNEFIEL